LTDKRRRNLKVHDKVEEEAGVFSGDVDKNLSNQNIRDDSESQTRQLSTSSEETITFKRGRGPSHN